MIQVAITRDDGHVTYLKGESGIASCMGNIAENPAETDPPTISLRCSNSVEMAWNLAGVMAAVRHLHAPAFEMALELMVFINIGKEAEVNELPKREKDL